MTPEVTGLADELLALSFRQSPLSAALLGLDEVDGDLEDLSSDAEHELIGAFEQVVSRARAVVQGERPALREESELVALDHISLTASARATRLRVPLVGFTVSNYYAAPLSNLIAVLPQLPLDTTSRHDRYLRRLEAMPTFLQQAADRHRASLSVGHTPTERGVRVAIAQLDDVANDPDLSGVRRRVDGPERDAFAASQGRIIEERVLPALETYRACLSEELRGRGRADENPGLCWLDGGAEMYGQLVGYHTWSDRTAQEVHELGLGLVDQLKVEFSTIGDRLWSTGDFSEICTRILTDPALHFDSSEEILATAIGAVRRAEEQAPKWFGVVPKEPCAVSPIPDALASGSAVAYYFGGALDGSRPGTYFVNTTRPEMRNRHVAESIAYHEAVPGHHFQLTIAQEMTSAHLVLRVTRDGTNAEGWGLYSERLADEMGLYSDDVSRLGMLTTDAMRAARLVVDTGLHALGWSRQRAIDWMCANVPLAEIEIVQEVDRYIVSPGQALSYMFGRIEIEHCRRRSEAKLGARFDLRSFHDLVLTTGPVALPALSAAVARWTDSGPGVRTA